MQSKNTIRIEFLVPCPGRYKRYKQFESYDVEEETAKKYIQNGYAKRE